MAEEPPLRVTASRHFLSWLRECNISLGFTTYQTNRLFLIGLKEDGRLSIFERLFERAMGLYATPERLWMSTRYQIWRFEDALPPGQMYEGYDRLYVPRRAYTTGDLDVHDMAVDRDGRIIFVNTLYGCLATVSERYSFRPLWKPPFVSRLVPEDRCHLNGMAMADGMPAYVTAVSRSDVVAGWRERRHTGGCVIDVEDDEIVLDSLSMPHSPRVHDDRLWLLNSGTGELGYVDRRAGRFEPVVFCPGYLRGLAFYGDWAVVGLSKPRHERTFSGLALDDRLREKDTEARCGLWVIDLRTGMVAHWLELEGVVVELYDVVVIPETRRSMSLGFKTDEIQRLVTIDTEEGPRFEPLRTSEPMPATGQSPPFVVRGEEKAPAAPPPPQYRQANELARQERYEEAVPLYEEALRAEPRHVNGWVNLGTVHHRLGDRDAALRCWRKALEIDPASHRAHGNLARALSETGDVDGALAHWEAAVRAAPGEAEPRLELAVLLSAVGRVGEARRHVEAVLKAEPGNARAWNAYGALDSLEQKHVQALRHFARAATLDPDLFEAQLNCGNSAEAVGDIPAAREAYGRALTIRDEPVLALRRELLCPPVFESAEALDAYLEHAAAVLQAFRGRDLRLQPAQVHFTRAETPFQWAYLGRDLLPLRRDYAALFAGSFAEEEPLPPPAPRPPWRVAFVVTATHEGVFLRCMAGTLDRLDRERFRVTVCCPRASFPNMLRNLRRRDVELIELPQRFDHAASVLRSGRFDALYFWEVGTDTTNYFLPFLRLAPVQCTGWGWPETAAVPHLDDHISSEALAPPGCERLFGEPLYRLPHLPAYMVRPPGQRWDAVPLDRFGLPAEANLYLCTQNLRKAHPDMDPLLGAILRADPRGVVAFVHDRAPHMGKLLRQRWERTLGDVLDRLVILPRQDAQGYVSLLSSAAVLLDTLHFGGANTAYDAYLAGVPVVTLPGEHPHGRYTAALHAAAGVEGCTAASAAEYVELAVRLGTDPQWREEVRRAIREGGDRIFEREETAADLGAFFEHAIREAAEGKRAGSEEARDSGGQA